MQDPRWGGLRGPALLLLPGVWEAYDGRNYSKSKGESQRFSLSTFSQKCVVVLVFTTVRLQSAMLGEMSPSQNSTFVIIFFDFFFPLHNANKSYKSYV